MELWHARVLVRHLGWMSTAVVGSLQMQTPASHPLIQASSRLLVQGHIVTHLTMAQAPSLAGPMITQLSSAQMLTGDLFFPTAKLLKHLFVHMSWIEFAP